MTEAEKLRLKTMYAGMPELQLIEMLLGDKEEYEEEAYEFLWQEAKQRGLEEKIKRKKKAQDEKKKAQGGKPEEFIPIFETYNSQDIAFLKSLFQASSIEYIIENENYASIRPLAGVPMILKVDIKQLDEARELLRDFRGGKFGQHKIEP